MLPPVSLGQGAPASAPATVSNTTKSGPGSAAFGNIMDSLTAAGRDHGACPAELPESRIQSSDESSHDEEPDEHSDEPALNRRIRRASPGASTEQTQLVSTVIGGLVAPPPQTPLHATGSHGSTETDAADTAGSHKERLSHPGSGETQSPVPSQRAPRGTSGTPSVQDLATKRNSTESLAETLSPSQPAPHAEPGAEAGASTVPGSKQERIAEPARAGSMANGPPNAAETHSATSKAANPITFSHGRMCQTAAGKPCSVGEAPLGTPGAQDMAQMKKAEKMLKIAGSAQQNLPEKGDRAISAAGTSLGRDGAPGSAVANEQLSAASTSNNEPASLRVEHSPAISSAADSTRLGSLERTHDLVAAHALRLRESGSDHLRVVIQPGDGTQLSIELKHANGRIEAQATLQQGDFEHLNRHWAELQQRLEPRKIQLSALQHTGHNSTENSPSSQHHKRPSKEERAGSYTTDFVFGGSMTESPVSRSARKKTNRGWETWA